jgi:tRNA pseudouridine13 synthase
MPESESTSFLPDWPRAGEPPLAAGIVKAVPEDFKVFELPVCLPDGAGEHLWLKIRKRGWNTSRVAAVLARWAEVRPRDVSYAGLKDRQAVTEQWFSIVLPGRETPALPAKWEPGIEVLELARHGRKLRRGALRGNRFEITLRDCRGERSAVAAMVERMAVEGVPNYFGDQRFGHNGANIPKARQMLRGKRRVRDREMRGLLISAARSLVFNEVLAARVVAGIWNRPLAGDLMMLEGGHSLFAVETVDDALRQRVATGEIDPTGPLPGAAGKLQVSADAAGLENQVCEAYQPIIKGLMKQRVDAARRPLRVVPKALVHEWMDENSLRLSFELPAGSYATAVLKELLAGP